MVSGNQPNLLAVDWSKIPAPQDDGGARHLAGLAVPDVALPATDGTKISLARIPGRAVVFAYPRTGVPGQPSLVDDWDMIPGARGCTPQTCAFRDLHKMLTRYAESRGYSTEALSSSPADQGGFKESTFAIKGDGAFSIFKFEGGTHRVQRVPATESQGRIHTSTVTVDNVKPSVTALSNSGPNSSER